jgi:hypothetical protein
MMKPRASAKGGNVRPPVLHLTLHREYFDAIAEGRKKTEYRNSSAYWRSRLVGRKYAEIIFRNGYATRAPLIRVQCLGIRKDGPDHFAIRLGKILEVKNYGKAKR